MGQTAGASQQKAQLAQNQAQQQAEQAQAQQALGTYNTTVAGLTPSIQQTQADVNQLPGSISQAQDYVTGLTPSIQQGQTDVNAESQSIGAQSDAAAQQQADVNAFQQTPGYTDAEIGAMDANAAGQIHGEYGDEMTQLKANAATQGGNDAGLSSQLASATQQRALATEQGAQNVAVTAANADLAGRQLIPGMQGAAAGTEAGVVGSQNTQASGQSGITGQLSNQATQQGAITGQIGNEASAQGAVTGQEATQAGLEYQPVNTLTNEATQTGSQDVSLIGQMPKTNPWIGVLQSGLQAAGQAAGAYAKTGCFVAAELFGGWEDPRTVLMRRWLHEEYAKSSPFGAILVALYVRFGEYVAIAIRRSIILRRLASKVFEAGLRRARIWQDEMRQGQIKHG
jgi:hypothetical protein